MKPRKYLFKIISLFIFPFLVIVSVFCFYVTKSFYILKDDASDSAQTISTYYYTDKIVQGNSELQILKNANNYFSFKYLLKEGALYHFAVACFSPGENKSFNLSDFDYVILKIKASKGTRLPIHIVSVQSSNNKNDSVNSYKRPSQFIINTTNEWQTIEIPLAEFYTPDWWYSQHSKKENDFAKPDFSKVVEISVGNCINLKNNIEDVVEIKGLAFHKSLFPFYLYSSLFLLIYFSIVSFVFLRHKRPFPKVTFDYQSQNDISNLNKEEEIIFNFISSNYYRSEFTILDIQSGTGIAERKISQVIKNKTNLNFKQFLNKLRITEAKRLLIETDLQVSEIADKTGYNNVPHFNRVFKSLENQSPNDFRKNVKVKLQG